MTKWALVILAMVFLSACGRGGVEGFSAPKDTPVTTVFQDGCATCHGDEGGGKFGILFKLSPAGKTAQELAETILVGHEGMPAFPNLSESQRLALAEHILSIRQ